MSCGRENATAIDMENDRLLCASESNEGTPSHKSLRLPQWRRYPRRDCLVPAHGDKRRRRARNGDDFRDDLDRGHIPGGVCACVLLNAQVVSMTVRNIQRSSRRAELEWWRIDSDRGSRFADYLTSHHHYIMGSHRFDFFKSPQHKRGWVTATSTDLCGSGKNHGYATTIDTLSDDVLLVIFDSYKLKIGELEGELPYQPWKWDRLVHVCRRWRQIIFASPNRLDIRIRCAHRTSVRSHLNYWPALPVVVDYYNTFHKLSCSDEDNLLAALEHPNRVCVLNIGVMPTQLGKLVKALQQPYPTLTYLRLNLYPRFHAPVGFLSGSASCLQEISLKAVTFPALPTLLLSTSHLVELRLDDIPKAGYISPKAMVVGLAALTNLRSLCIRVDSGFRSTKSLPGRTSSSPVMRTVLPALTSFEFLGVSGYLEDLLARIDFPQIKTIEIHFLHLPVDVTVDFRVAQLFEFINRLEDPKLTQFGWLDICFLSDGNIGLQFRHPRYDFVIQISFLGTRWEVSHVVHMFSQFSTKLSDVEFFEQFITAFVREPDEFYDRLNPYLSEEDKDLVHWI
ncbi:hypothetical protein EDB89DRAFT_2247503 [Lactarius sanguifluus]|nr:hypothetical protein EDB89DRAFT_2247503 [Lactarius sanguifluus]